MVEYVRIHGYRLQHAKEVRNLQFSENEIANNNIENEYNNVNTDAISNF